jgi:hypothetical protein
MTIPRLFFACFILLAALASRSPAAERPSLPLTLPASARPAWLADEGLVMAGSWEPLPFRVRRDGEGFTPTPEQKEAYRREHSPEMVAQLKALGVNFVMMHGYKGGGLNFERESMNDAVRFADLCHEAGLHVGVYAYSGALMWEPLLKEIPSAWEWFLLDEHGDPVRYYNLPYRYRWNRNHPGAMEFYKGIIRFAVEDIKADLIHLDNHSAGPGFDGNSQKRFREYLAKNFSAERLAQMGVRDTAKTTPPRSTDTNDLFKRAWSEFRFQSLADAYYEIGAYARSLRPDVLMELNAGGVSPRIRGAVDHGRLLQGGEAFWSEGRMEPWHGEGPMLNNIWAYKFARRMDNMMFRYVTTPLQVAEAMAFNLDAIGCLVAFEYGKLSDFPGAKGREMDPARQPFVKFFRERRELFKHTQVIADTAVLRNFPTEAFAPASRDNVSTEVANQLIAMRATFQPIPDAHLKDAGRFHVLVLPDCLAMSDEQIARVRDYVAGGGQLCVVGELATHDEWMLPRKKPALDDLPAGRVIRVATAKDIPAAIERAMGGRDALKISAKDGGANTSDDVLRGLCVELTTRDHQIFVHLVNYHDGVAKENIAVRVRIDDSRQVKSVHLASPEMSADAAVPFKQDGEFVTFTVPKVNIYTIAVVDTR